MSAQPVPIEPRMVGMDEVVDLIAGLSAVQGGSTRGRVTRNLIVDLAYTVRVLRSQDEARQAALREAQAGEGADDAVALADEWEQWAQDARTRESEALGERDRLAAELQGRVNPPHRTGGTLTPLTLAAFRERLDGQPSMFDDEDWGPCGCTDVT